MMIDGMPDGEQRFLYHPSSFLSLTGQVSSSGSTAISAFLLALTIFSFSTTLRVFATLRISFLRIRTSAILATAFRLPLLLFRIFTFSS